MLQCRIIEMSVLMFLCIAVISVMMVSAFVCFTCAGVNIREEDLSNISHASVYESSSAVASALSRPKVSKWIKRGVLLCGLSFLFGIVMVSAFLTYRSMSGAIVIEPSQP